MDALISDLPIELRKEILSYIGINSIEEADKIMDKIQLKTRKVTYTRRGDEVVRYYDYVKIPEIILKMSSTNKKYDRFKTILKKDLKVGDVICNSDVDGIITKITECYIFYKRRLTTRKYIGYGGINTISFYSNNEFEDVEHKKMIKNINNYVLLNTNSYFIISNEQPY
jgi:Icc-related predicted phosphoesterase